jgi:hypothetical protein
LLTARHICNGQSPRVVSALHVSTYRTLKTKRLNSAVWKMRPFVNAVLSVG